MFSITAAKVVRDAVVPSAGFSVTVDGEPGFFEDRAVVGDGIDPEDRQISNPFRFQLESREREPCAASQDAPGFREHGPLVRGVLDRVDTHGAVGRGIVEARRRECAVLVAGTVREADALGVLGASASPVAEGSMPMSEAPD